MYRITMIALLLGLSGVASAKAEKTAMQMDRQAPVAQQIHQVETALGTPEYAELSIEDRGRVQQSLERIRQRMGDRQTVQELPPQVQADVFNEQEQINTLLARGHDDSRQICTYQRSTGSNMPKGRCLTVAERRRIEEKGRALINDQRSYSNLVPPSGR
ncbi:hypothetical protein E5C33_16970 [Stenotrophomonas maltophilia]|uniref:hypothetical protein n=1 Tax=Stenotrophomonas maltophilia TaxID=40324 RepID=UPI0010767B6D|nr:hypothetical protein [Stenotrophomonas maltophilia]TFZ43777.1 hypothetical protein E5C33_16970 [Stenotrophomonas maltophilia]